MSLLAHPSAYSHLMFLYFSGLILLLVLSLYLLHLGSISHTQNSTWPDFSCSLISPWRGFYRKRGHKSTHGPRESKKEMVMSVEHRSQQQSQFYIDRHLSVFCPRFLGFLLSVTLEFCFSGRSCSYLVWFAVISRILHSFPDQNM